mmetsp:Transcript_46664/g.92128  ORF Transcript_46664/g.92128 Transcript_46664/m.92128 type:complete len:109 (-) Transcript_46664:2760-3086(-)
MNPPTPTFYLYRAPPMFFLVSLLDVSISFRSTRRESGSGVERRSHESAAIPSLPFPSLTTHAGLHALDGGTQIGSCTNPNRQQARSRKNEETKNWREKKQKTQKRRVG